MAAVTHLHTNPVVEVLEGLGVGAFNLLTPFLRRQRTRWGTEGNEAIRPLPGDKLIPAPRWTSTHAVTINARPAQIWPWLVQIGEGRAGLYSYAALENLMGCNIRNADTIMPEWQNLKLGDGIRLHKSIPALPVVTIEPNHYLVLGGAPTYTPEFKAEVGVSWLFYLDRKAGGHTRLIVRWRSYYPLTTAMRLSFGPLFIEPIHFTMERKMLLGIKARVERG